MLARIGRYGSHYDIAKPLIEQLWSISESVITLACHARMRGSTPLWTAINGFIDQFGEHLPCTRGRGFKSLWIHHKL